MTKYQEIKALSDYASKQITENGQEWQKFLDCASKFTWYPFKDQIQGKDKVQLIGFGTFGTSERKALKDKVNTKPAKKAAKRK